MKKNMWILGVVVAFVATLFLSSGKVYALDIDLDATVNPNYLGSFTGLGDTTGTAYYSLGIDPTSPNGANYAHLVFESDIFASVSNLTEISVPTGWDLSIVGPGPGVPDALFTAIGFGAGDLLSPGESILFTVDYELTDTYAYYYGTDPNNISPLWAWSQDGPNAWAQAVSAILMLPPAGFASGGSSTTPVPEPATLLLLGSGLLGLGAMGRKRRKKKGLA